LSATDRRRLLYAALAAVPRWDNTTRETEYVESQLLAAA